MDVRFHLPLEELVRLERAEKNAARSKRLRIIILALGGYTAPAIAMSLGLSRRICQRWVYRYNEEGLEGLNDRRGGEKSQPTLTPQQKQQVCQRLEAGPTPEDQVCSLRGVDVQRILATEFGVLRSLSGIYHLLHRLGYSYLRPRPRHRRANPQAQDEFKADLPARLQPSAGRIPARKCESIFKMNHASASKARRPTCGPVADHDQRPCGRPNINICGCWARSVRRPGTRKVC